MELQHIKAFLDIIEGLFKCAGLLVGGLFVLYKVRTGWLIIDLKLKVTTERREQDMGRDHMTITVSMDKGSKDSLSISGLSCRVTELGNSASGDAPEIIPITGYERIGEMANGAVDWSGRAEKSPIYFSPGDSVEFAAYHSVRSGGVYLVEVVLLGDNRIFKSFRGRTLQWRCSTISLPEAKLGTENRRPREVSGDAIWGSSDFFKCARWQSVNTRATSNHVQMEGVDKELENTIGGAGFCAGGGVGADRGAVSVLPFPDVFPPR